MDGNKLAPAGSGMVWETLSAHRFFQFLLCKIPKFAVVFSFVIGYNRNNLKCTTTLVILNLHLL